MHPVPVLAIGRPALVFLTVCTAQRKRILARPAAHDLLREVWCDGSTWLVGRYVVMPDHLHLFCSPRAAVPLATWVRFWKAAVSRQWPNRDDHPVWQRDFWDTQLRREASYEGRWEYVRQNPVRRGLASHPDAWPYAGEIHTLDW